ncbi:MAG: hypothetical protein KatS3mg083_257 [Candidatus Dojkabacteria bacterium]|nr:MAG: hypothetical protein KatS3mg083_257 [Candidatus Dojkabacteria bacterium]
MEFKLDENEARNAQKREAIADAYADGVIRQFDQKVREAADMFNIRYDKQIEMPKEYGGGGGGGKKSTSTVPEVDTRVYHSINSVYDSLNQQENNTYPISIGFRANMALMSGSKGVLTEGHMINNFFVKIKDREGFKERFFPGVNDIPNWELPDNPNSAVNYNISWTPDFGIGVAQFDNTGDGHVNYKFMSGFGNIKSLYDTYIDDVNPSTITDDFAQLLRTINNPGLAADLELIPVSLDYSEAEGVMSDILNIEPGWFDDISDVSVALGGFTLNNFRLNPDGTVSFEMDPTSIELSTARYGDLDKGDPEHMAALNIARSIATNMAAFNKVSPDDIGVAALPAKDGSHFLIFIRYKDAKGAIKTYSALKIDKSIVDKYKPALSIDYNYLVNNAKDVVNSLYLEINDPISETVRTMKNSGISSQLLDKAKSIIEKWRKEFSDKEYSGKLTPEQEANFIKDMTKVMFYLPIRGQGGIMEKVSQIDLMLNRSVLPS